MLTGKRCLIWYQWSKFEAMKRAELRQNRHSSDKKDEKDVQHPARSLVLSLSFLQQQEALVPLLPGSTCSLTHCQLRFPSGAQWGQPVHQHTARHWGCLVERFDLLQFPATTAKNLFRTHLSEQQSQKLFDTHFLLILMETNCYYEYFFISFALWQLQY